MYIDSHLALTYFSITKNSTFWPTGLKIPIPCIKNISTQEEVLGGAGGGGIIILLSTQNAKLTHDWLRIMMNHAKGSNCWYRSGGMCAFDHKVL